VRSLERECLLRVLQAQIAISCRLVDYSWLGSGAATAGGGFAKVAGAGRLGRDQSVDCSGLARPYQAACSEVMNSEVCWSVRPKNRLFEVIFAGCWDYFLRWAALASSRQVMHLDRYLGR